MAAEVWQRYSASLRAVYSKFYCAGVPMVALPLFGDHPASAARLAHLGLAVELGAASVSTEAVRTAVAAVLDDPPATGPTPGTCDAGCTPWRPWTGRRTTCGRSSPIPAAEPEPD